MVFASKLAELSIPSFFPESEQLFANRADNRLPCLLRVPLRSAY
jgi:hypothetical protein